MHTCMHGHKYICVIYMLNNNKEEVVSLRGSRKKAWEELERGKEAMEMMQIQYSGSKL